MWDVFANGIGILSFVFVWMIAFGKDGFLRNGPVEFPWGSPIQLAKDEFASGLDDKNKRDELYCAIN